MNPTLGHWQGEVLRPGNPHRLGAHATSDGVHFAVWAEHASRVELCLFDEESFQELARLPLPGLDDGIWHGFLAGARPGLVYGYRVHGRFDPDTGQLFDPDKVLLDPWARRIARLPTWHASLKAGNGLDSATTAPLAAVAEPLPPADEPRPRTPRGRTVLYEAHPKGLTKLHPGVPEALRGTWAGLSHPSVIAHLKDLGVTAVELLPVHAHADDAFLVEKGLSNYWGYSTLGYFAPHPSWASRPGQELSEFRETVRTLHAEGIEVILDVVYNHTCEGGPDGPHLSWRGFGAWYRRSPGNPDFHEDFTGCGNSLDLRRPAALRLVVESLRFWAVEMGVDGFRFDLASVLGRVSPDFDPSSPFFQILAKDPILSRLKLIAEPWDASWDGYRLGHYPRGWSEWNDRFRDGVRSFWKGEGSGAEFARRMNGSDDLFPGKGPKASVNFATCHDGFTLRDLVSYAHKHNEANLEDNRDGADHNRSWNCGTEGPATPAVEALRARLCRSLLGTVLLARGIPMLLSGDELGQTQHGNNNAYCQDNPLSWLRWDPEPEYDRNHSFTRRAARLRRKHLSIEFPLRSFSPDAVPSAPDGALSLLLGEDLLGLFNPCGHEVRFHLPLPPHGRRWCFELSSADPDREADDIPVHECIAPAHSLTVLSGR